MGNQIQTRLQTTCNTGKVVIISRETTIHCKRCNRPLTKPQSVQRGYGDVCYRKVNSEKVERVTTQSKIDDFFSKLNQD